MKVKTEVSGPPAGQLSDVWFLDRISEWARKEPDRFAFAVDHPDETKEYTYSDVYDHSSRIAAALSSSGVQPGDRVGILMDNSPHWVFIMLAVIRLGGIGVPLSVLLPAFSVRLP